MAAARRPLIAGNWKMNGSLAEGRALTAELMALLNRGPHPFDMLVCPPATLLATLATAARGSVLRLGGQDCHAEVKGAYTGDISAEMLKEAGASAVIVGHSERRTLHGESDETVRAKAAAARRAGLTAIVCIGETLAQRDAGQTLAVLEAQVLGSVPEASRASGLVVAYEPVWAIGTGRTPSGDDVAAAHAHIRKTLAQRVDKAAETRILYGGSVKPENAAVLLGLEDVDGALVGGASLKSADFWAIATATH
ncbi:MAG: triose-phosphate isomerase [Reyranellaceae bacterium]